MKRGWSFALLAIVGCSSQDSVATSPNAGPEAGGDGDVTGPPGEAGPPSGDVGPPYRFRYGINDGHRNGSWGDDKEATLASRAGAHSLRVKLPAMHLEKWGADIEVSDVKAYEALGMKDHLGFLIGSATIKQSTAPAGSPDWQNEQWIPKNLYEPIVGPDGKVNPNNYWAAYVYKAVSTYKPWIHVWHVWNEPDWVSDWNVTKTWNTEPPKASDLPRFHGSIFEYVRMLRVTREAARLADPEALVATGGIGYPSFLAALLRYTDDPAGGAVSAAYPSRGGAYVDVLDLHSYPIFGPKSSDAGVDGLLALKREMQAALDAAGVKVVAWNVSETGAPLTKTAGASVGGAEFARNYLLKTFTLAQANGIAGVDWFILSNGDATGGAFEHMGLYEDVASLPNVDAAKKTDLGVAYTTLWERLGGTKFDRPATDALKLPSTVRGAAFTDGKRRLVLWAATPADSETATTTLDVPTDRGFDAYAWDGAKTEKPASGGKVTLALTGSPTFFVER